MLGYLILIHSFYTFYITWKILNYLWPSSEEEKYIRTYGLCDVLLDSYGKKYRAKHIITLQRFYRRNKKYFAFKKLIQSEDFISWLYHPQNVGGKLAKRSISSFIENDLKN